MVVFPLPSIVKALAPLLMSPPIVSVFEELFVHVWAAPSAKKEFSVTGPAPLLTVMPAVLADGVMVSCRPSALRATALGVPAKSLMVRLLIVIFAPSTMLVRSDGDVLSVMNTSAAVPGVRLVATAPAVSVVQLLADEPLEMAHTFVSPASPPFQ